MKNRFLFRAKIFEGRQTILRLFGVAIWGSNHYRNAGWFRLFGRGLKWKHETVGLTFSERNGYSKFVRAGKWIVAYLPKINIDAPIESQKAISKEGLDRNRVAAWISMWEDAPRMWGVKFISQGSKETDCLPSLKG
jgi:hypothetical protein